MLNLQTQGELRCLWKLRNYGAPRDRSVQKFTLIEISSPDLTQLIWLIWSFLYQAIECHSIVIEVQTSSLDMALRANHGAWTCRDMSTKQGKISGEIDAPQHQSSQCQISRDESRVLALEMEQKKPLLKYTLQEPLTDGGSFIIFVYICFILFHIFKISVGVGFEFESFAPALAAAVKCLRWNCSSMCIKSRFQSENSTRNIIKAGRNRRYTYLAWQKQRSCIIFPRDSIYVLDKPRYFPFLIF